MLLSQVSWLWCCQLLSQHLKPCWDQSFFLLVKPRSIELFFGGHSSVVVSSLSQRIVFFSSSQFSFDPCFTFTGELVLTLSASQSAPQTLLGTEHSLCSLNLADSVLALSDSQSAPRTKFGAECIFIVLVKPSSLTKDSRSLHFLHHHRGSSAVQLSLQSNSAVYEQLTMSGWATELVQDYGVLTWQSQATPSKHLGLSFWSSTKTKVKRCCLSLLHGHGNSAKLMLSASTQSK